MHSKIQEDQTSSPDQSNQAVQRKATTSPKKNKPAYHNNKMVTREQSTPPPSTREGQLGAVPTHHRVVQTKQGQQLPHQAKQAVVQRKPQTVKEGDFHEETTTDANDSYKRYPIKKTFRGAITGTSYKIDFPVGMLVEVVSDSGEAKVQIRMKRYGKHYVGKISRNLINWGAAKEFHPEEELSEDFTQPGWKPVNQLGIAYKDEGVFLRDKPLPAGTGSLKTGYLNQNDKAMVLHQNSETGWCFVSSTSGQLGYVAASHLWTNLPAPDVQVKKIRSGETALEVAQNYYQGSFNRWGQDKRFLVNALVYANQKYNLNANNSVGNKQAGIHKANQHDSWDKTTLIAGQYIWLPSATYLDTLKGQVSSGSYSYEAYQGALEVMEGAYKFVAYTLGFVGGLVHGAVYNIYEKLADIVESVVGVFQTFWKLITGQLWQDLQQMGEAIYKIINDPAQLKEFLKELAQGLFGAILDKVAKLTSDNPWEAGHAAGYLTGYLAAEVLLAIFSGGAALLTRLAKLGKLGVMLNKIIGKAQGLIKKVPDPFNKRKKKNGNKDRNDEKDENKLIQKQKALVMAKMITEGQDKANAPIPVLMASLEAVKKKYPVVKGFYPKNKGNGHYEIWMRASDLEVDGDYTPGDNPSSKPTYKIGESDGGPGTWQKEAVTGKPADMEFQQRVTGAPQGVEYPVSGPNAAGKVKFDGYDPARGVLLDAKRFDGFPKIHKGRIIGERNILDEARRQINANRNGFKIEWHVSNEEKANLLKELFQRNGINDIEVVFPPKFMN